MTQKTIIMLTLATALGIAIGVIGSHVIITQHESPYLKSPERLGDVVAALSVMGTYEFDGREPGAWGSLIGGDPKSTAFWSDVFKEHSEFFRTDKENNKVYLVWRRARKQVWDTKTRKEITQDELARLSPDDQNKRLSRQPLTPEDTTKLIEIAINMQTQAIARRQEMRWWVPVLVGVLCVFIGANLKSGK